MKVKQMRIPYLKVDSMANEYRVFTKAELRRKVFLGLEELLEEAKKRFGKVYEKSNFLGAIIVDPDIDFTKIDRTMLFVAPGILAVVDEIWERTQLKKAA